MKALKSKVLHCTLYIIPVHVSEEAIIDWDVFVPPLLIMFVLPVDEVMLQAGVVGLGARQRGGLHLHHTQGGVVLQNLARRLLQVCYSYSQHLGHVAVYVVGVEEDGVGPQGAQHLHPLHQPQAAVTAQTQTLRAHRYPPPARVLGHAAHSVMEY